MSVYERYINITSSKEAMNVGALKYHHRYLSFLLHESPSVGVESVLYIFDRLEQWMKEYAPYGCLSMNAMAAFPDNSLIGKAVKQHKKEVQQFLGLQSQKMTFQRYFFYSTKGFQVHGLY